MNHRKFKKSKAQVGKYYVKPPRQNRSLKRQEYKNKNQAMALLIVCILLLQLLAELIIALLPQGK